MTQWFYFDRNGHKTGPMDSDSLKLLAEHGMITPDTIVMTDSGKSCLAKKVKGLSFSLCILEPPVFVPPTINTDVKKTTKENPSQNTSIKNMTEICNEKFKAMNIYKKIILCFIVLSSWLYFTLWIIAWLIFPLGGTNFGILPLTEKQAIERYNYYIRRAAQAEEESYNPYRSKWERDASRQTKASLKKIADDISDYYRLLDNDYYNKK